jgi:hypothetical protein
VGTVVIIEALPLSQTPLEIYVTIVRKQLIELFLICAVRALDLAVELGRPWLDVYVLNPEVCHVPMEERLALVHESKSTRIPPEISFVMHRVFGSATFRASTPVQ